MYIYSKGTYTSMNYKKPVEARVMLHARERDFNLGDVEKPGPFFTKDLTTNLKRSSMSSEWSYDCDLLRNGAQLSKSYGMLS